MADSEGGAGGSTGTVAVYGSGQDIPTLNITNGINQPTLLGVGPSEELYVANSYLDAVNATITVYSLNDGSLLHTIRSGIHDPAVDRVRFPGKPLRR